MTRVVDLLQYLIEERGSDLLVKVGSPPCLRRNGRLERTTLDSLDPGAIEALAGELLTPAKTLRTAGDRRDRPGSQRPRARAVPSQHLPPARFAQPGHEVLHADRVAIVSQREVGTDTADTAEALRRVGRQRADVIFVSDLSNADAISEAMNVAAAGRLVLAVMNTLSVTDTIGLIVDRAERHLQHHTRLMLARVLRGIVCQRLVDRADGRGRVAVVEALTGTAKVCEAIAGGDDLGVLERLMNEGRYHGMATFDQALFQLFTEDYVAVDEALEQAVNPEDSASWSNRPASPPCGDRQRSATARRRHPRSRNGTPVVAEASPSVERVIPDRLQPVLAEVAPLADAFAAAGHRLYLVGGIVRDQLLGRHLGPDADIDLTTDARPPEVKRLLAPLADVIWSQGERFGTIGAKVGGRPFEITTHRAEAYDPASRKPVVAFGDDIEDDLARRDFSVNAMALALPEPELIDPFGGAADLAAGRLRTPLAPEVSFTEDPLRMLRAARFIAGYGLEPAAELVDAVRANVHRLEIVSAERIRAELDKLLVVPDPSAGLWFVVDTGLAEAFLPELKAMRLEQDPVHHHKDVLAHTIAVVAKTRPERIVRLAALLHDVGKPKTRSFGPGGVSFHHHEVVGARMARDRMQALKYSNDDIDAVRELVYLHLRFHTYRLGWTDSAVRRFVRDAGPHLDRLIELTRCDCTTRNQRKAAVLARRMDELEVRIAALEEEEAVKAIRPDLDGRAVMDHLGVGPGPHVGQALAHLLELRLDEGPLGPEEAYRRLDAWWAARP